MPRSGEPGRERSYRCVTVIVWVRLEVVAVIVPLRVVPGEGLGTTVKVNVTGILPTEPPPLIQGTDVVTCALPPAHETVTRPTREEKVGFGASV